MRCLVLSAVLLTGVFAFAETQDSNLHMQTTTVTQEHPSFPSAYSGKNSLSSDEDSQASLTWTIFGGVRLWRGAEVYLNPELSGGSGFNKTQGIAAFPNGEIYRVDDPNPRWSLARLYLKQTFGLGGGREEIHEDKNQLAGAEDVDRLTVVLGRFALNDFFDNNTYSHDPRTQFLNWALMDHGAWDYAADTRGYSWGLYLELHREHWSLRFASVMEPQEANQMEMDKSFPASRGDNLEGEWRYEISEQPGAVRLLAFDNHANMGSYRATVDNPAYGMDVTQTRVRREKYGFGVNAEQAISADSGVFLRAAWNDGRAETWAFTEIDESFSAGLSWKGTAWRRPKDLFGAAVVVNGLSQDHKEYLEKGGYGFIIGDGRMTYAPEEIAEVFYLVSLVKGLDLSLDFQYLQNPAYNSDRGPAPIGSTRVHYEF